MYVTSAEAVLYHASYFMCLRLWATSNYSLSDAVKLALVGNIEVPGAIIHLLKKTSLVRGLQV